MLVFSQQTLPLEGKDFSNYLQGGKLKRTHGATSSKTRRPNVLECKQITVYHLPTCNSIAGLGSLILILILSHIFEASVEVSVNETVNGSNICEWIKYL